jgi:hypothetical protein
MPQINGKFTAAIKTIDRTISTWSINFSILVVGKNSTINSDIKAKKPAKIPNEFQDPMRLSVFSAKNPSDEAWGKNKCTLWKRETKILDNINPNKTILAFLGSLKMIEDISNKRKPEKINQKDPRSNIVPKRDVCEVLEKRADSKNAKTMPPAPNKHVDLGKLILPSMNLAMAQKITQKTSPTTKSTPLEISTGMLVKGKKKKGNNTITKNSDKKDNLSNMFERISLLY